MIPWQAEHRFPLAHSEHGRPPRPDGHRIEEEFRSHGFEHAFNEIVLSHRNAARQNQRIFLESALDFLSQIFDSVRRIPQDNGLAARNANLRSKRDTIAVSNMKLSR